MAEGHWLVTVERNGEKVVTIEPNCLSGRDVSREDEDAIRAAAGHLLAFIGDPPPPEPKVVADVDELRAALTPLARLEVPKRPQGNAGAYSIRHSDIQRAQAALKEAPPEPAHARQTYPGFDWWRDR